MLPWLQSIDAALYRFINLKLSCSFLDKVMPWLAGNVGFIPAVVLLALAFLWKGGARERLFVVVLALVLGAGDTLLINGLKHVAARPRPFVNLPDARRLVGYGESASMPSSHTSTWFAAALVAFVYFRRSWRFMLPLACLVGFSRVYLGVHYPSDVLVGAVLGAGYASAGLWAIEAFWQRLGRAWFPIWWNKLPSLIAPKPAASAAISITPSHDLVEAQYLRLSYIVIGGLLVARLLYLSAHIIDLGEDEAYQWLWSKHLALSYYSKPPLIAVTQFLGTHLWGDTEFGVRFFSPVFAAVLSFITARFMAREVSARAGFFLVLIVTCTPLLAAGTVLMTVDPLLVLFWTAAMLVGWRAVQPDGTTRQWLAVGLFTGLGFLSKYTAAIQWVCWALFFLLWPAARAQLKRPGPWLAAGVFLLCTLPVVLWNSQHDWVAVHHVSENGRLDKAWSPTLRYFAEFTASEALLLHPIFFIAGLWAMFAFWKRRNENPLLLYFFAMGAPVLFGYWLYTFRARVHPNWIAAAVLPMLCLMATWWHTRWREGARGIKGWLIAALATGAVAVLLLHDTNLIYRIAHVRLPAHYDPTRRVRGVNEMTHVVAKARSELRAEGKEVFIIAAHYGLTGQLSFYLPQARDGLPNAPLVYVRTSRHPKNQFYFWPQYRYPERRKSQNALFVMDVDGPEKPPEEVLEQFQSVTDLGVREIRSRKQVVRRIQLFACRNLL
jgi:4-amino-4-deoxy-L-arabinose transferase-like glycosyltransferase/membrane-associated phospholipid phosphatase